jgi:catechol 2,3-dioxygenase-like lactoylglutathione lyase family enzyme
MINHVNALGLPVRNVEKCAQFYREKLGFTLIDMHEEDAFLRIGEKRAKGSTVLARLSMTKVAALISPEQVRPTGESIHRTLFAVFLDDADTAYEELGPKGVHFVQPPTTQPWGQRVACFEDPEGNLGGISHVPKA